MKTTRRTRQEATARDDFAQRMVAALQRRGVAGPIRYDKARFNLVLPSGPVSLGDLFEPCRQGPAWDYQRRIDLFAGAIATTMSYTMPASFAEARPHLRVDVRPLAEVERERRRGSELVCTPIAEDLAECLVLDMPEAKLYLTHETAAWGSVDHPTLLEVGRQNLLRHSPPGLRRTSGGYWASTWQDDYDAGRLALPGLLRDATGIRGELVVMLPTSMSLLVAPAAEPQALAAMARDVASTLGAPRYRTARAYVERQGQWRPFLPPADHPAFAGLNELSVYTDVEALNAQLGVVVAQARQRGSGGAGPVPSLARVLRLPGEGGVASLTMIQLGSPALIAATEYVGFLTFDRAARHIKDYGYCRLQALLDLLGPDATPMHWHPQRYALRRPVQREDLARLPRVDETGQPVHEPIERPMPATGDGASF